jgi:hypothetical protein
MRRHIAARMNTARHVAMLTHLAGLPGLEQNDALAVHAVAAVGVFRARLQLKHMAHVSC